MKKQLLKLGYDAKTIDAYVATKSDQQMGNMHRAVVSLIYKKDYAYIPKAFNQWKAYVQRRKQVKLRAKQVLNWMRHPLAIAFNKWKYDMGDAESKLKGISKQQLIDKIISHENLIGSTQSRLSRMGDTIDMLAFQRDNLFGHFMRGQKLAITLCKNNALKSKFRAFMRWKRVHQEGQTMDLIEQLEKTNQMITELQQHVGRLEGINRNLLYENEELRQAALDGIEISNVVQELTRERESLSADLQDRAGTIRRLIDDNNTLAMRLNHIQQDAVQMQQSVSVYNDPPGRDY